jgi:hypothetical protein
MSPSTGEANDLIVVRSFTTRTEAEIAQSALDAYGVECVISSDDCAGLRPAMTLTRGVQLLIRPDDRERAEEVLAGPESEDSKAC